jgi:HSP20 family protein
MPFSENCWSAGAWLYKEEQQCYFTQLIALQARSCQQIEVAANHFIRQESAMDYIKVNFGDQFDPFGSQIEKTLQEIFRPRPVSPMFACKDCSWVPQMDMYESNEQIVIWAELAGVDKENLEVEVNAKAVHISGFRKETPREPKGTYRLAEIRYGKFERILYLPSQVDTDVVSSSFVNGLLTIQMAKAQVRRTHKIPIVDG